MSIKNVIFIILVIGIILCIIVRFLYYFHVKNKIKEISKKINYKINPGEIVESNDSIVHMRGYLNDDLIDSLYNESMLVGKFYNTTRSDSIYTNKDNTPNILAHYGYYNTPSIFQHSPINTINFGYKFYSYIYSSLGSLKTIKTLPKKEEFKDSSLLTIGYKKDDTFRYHYDMNKKGGFIISISLGADAIFNYIDNQDKEHEIVLKHKDILILDGGKTKHSVKKIISNDNFSYKDHNNNKLERLNIQIRCFKV